MQLINRILSRIPPWIIYCIAGFCAARLFYLGATNQLGADPVDFMTDQYGLWALQFLMASLAITPLRYLGINAVRFRRATGLVAFFMAIAHFLTWLWLDRGFFWSEIWREIIKRPFITIGVISFLIMLPLAITSNNRAIRRFGPLRWRKLHKLAYPLALLVPIHFIMVVKGYPPEPFVYLGIGVFLLLIRMAHSLWKAPKKKRAGSKTSP